MQSQQSKMSPLLHCRLSGEHSEYGNELRHIRYVVGIRAEVMIEVDSKSSSIQVADATIAFIVGKLDVPIGLGGSEDCQIPNICPRISNL